MKRDFDFLIVTGPTASGKTKKALDIALENDGVIINCDSQQVYSDFKILSAYPDQKDIDSVLHKLFGYLEFNQETSAAEWAKLASKIICETLDQGKLPIVTGGTGMYIHILTKGISPMPEVSKETRQYVGDLAKNNFHELLNTIYNKDPKIQDYIKPENHRQAIRAMEIFYETGKSILDFYNKPKVKFIEGLKYKVILLNPERGVLYENINKRFDMMIKNGAIEEVEEFLHKHKDQEFEEIVRQPIFKIIGTKEIAQYIKGKTKLKDICENIKAQTRQYAKRQQTWFKKYI